MMNPIGGLPGESVTITIEPLEVPAPQEWPQEAPAENPVEEPVEVPA